jgi:predicted DCC family thiol-disulfide oxidoreductase YuxK
MHGLRQVFGIDLRGLALLRVALGAILLADLFIRGGDLVAHYSDAGAMPVDLIAGRASDWRISLHLLNGSAVYQACLFLLAAAFALALMLGYRTRLATALSWLLLLSLHNRNPLVLQGGDNLLLLLLFWGMFLPLGARASIDAALDRDPPSGNRYASLASAAILIQAMSVYFFSAMLKSAPDWLPDGTAVYFAFHIDQFATPVAEWLRQFPGLMRTLTFYVWWLELLGPLLIFSPWLRVPLRTTLVVLFVSMEIGFMACLRIGLFPFISIASILLFLPGEVWDRIARRIATARRAGLTMFYDADCGFCEKTCRILRELLILPGARILPAQPDPRVGPVLEAENSWVVEDAAGGQYLRFAGVIAVLEHSPWLGWLARIMRIGPFSRLGDRLYRWIADYRPTLSRITRRALPWRHRPVRQGIAGGILALGMLVYVTAWNVTTLPQAQLRFPPSLRPIRDVLRLDQHWNMFAPRPRRDDGWFVIPGELMDGRPTEVFSGRYGEPDYARPATLSDQFPNYRWRKYLTRLSQKSYQGYRADYGRYLCRGWNASASGDERLRRFQIWYVEERTRPDYLPPKIERHHIWRHWCFPEDAPDRASGPG